MKRRRSTTSDLAGGAGLLSGILEAADRDHCPGARPLVAYREGDYPEYLALLRKCSLRIVPVSRFGRPLLSVAELPATASSGATSKRLDALSTRWRAARPIVLPGWASALVLAERDPITNWSRVVRNLRKPGTLRKFLSSKLGRDTLEAATRLDDPERDLEKFFVRDGGSGARLWVKSATLTSPTTNGSGRVRFSFGREGDDDASADEQAHARVSEFARRCLPLADAIAKSRAHRGLLASFVGSPVLLTQHIGYWNAPEGGALLHHDAFDEPARSRQRGVCYVQLSGATIWLALCTADLVRHTRDFLAALEAGAAPWVVDDCFDNRKAFARITRRAREAGWLQEQLTSPGCGGFARMVNYSPEFLAVLVDAGHAWRLEAGDAILLPNFGRRRTCLHAVWCAGTAGAALSMAIRARRR
ncbi:MAG TPA: hypothetical protein VK843_05255 [Planctomycetota bacterium]|nr:hypothetical protein [Planctomycetota bacterium]